MFKYRIPQKVIDSFISVASRNFSREDGQHIETLAFLVGTKQDNILTVTDIVYPMQNGGPMKVEDEGSYEIIMSKCFFLEKSDKYKSFF